VYVWTVQRVEVTRSGVRLMDCVFRPANCVTATHSAMITVTKTTALISTVSILIHKSCYHATDLHSNMAHAHGFDN